MKRAAISTLTVLVACSTAVADHPPPPCSGVHVLGEYNVTVPPYAGQPEFLPAQALPLRLLGGALEGAVVVTVEGRTPPPPPGTGTLYGRPPLGPQGQPVVFGAVLDDPAVGTFVTVANFDQVTHDAHVLAAQVGVCQ